MLDTKYNHINVEKDKYNIWKEKGHFEPKNSNKGTFSIVLPPPNINKMCNIRASLGFTY